MMRGARCVVLGACCVLRAACCVLRSVLCVRACVRACVCGLLLTRKVHPPTSSNGNVQADNYGVSPSCGGALEWSAVAPAVHVAETFGYFRGGDEQVMTAPELLGRSGRREAPKKGATHSRISIPD